MGSARKGDHLHPIPLGAVDAVVAFSAWFVVLDSWGATKAATPLVMAAAALVGGVQATLGAALGTGAPYAGALASVTRRRALRAGVVTTLLMLALALVGPTVRDDGLVTPSLVAAGGVVATGSVLSWRWVHHRYASARRRRGDRVERVMIVADHRDAHDLLDLIEAHPDTGWHAVGWVDGDDSEPLITSARRAGASTVLVAASALRREHIQAQLHQLRDRGLRVHLDAGLRNLHPRHLTLGALGYEPLLLLEPPRLTMVQRFLKRVVDIMVATVMLVLSLPVLAVAAVAILLDDRGPVLFHQRRIGRHGVPFDVVKLRTMVRDAEGRLDEVAHLNERTDGPLFKASHDPRVTRVGRVLRATSIDEIPQLWRVIRGDMSLVGPRPALPDEVSQFDDRLMARHRMRPGLTGIWQVSHRDDPSFEAYRRADLLYVEHWSLLLDLSILARTVPTVLGRGVKSLRTRAVPSPEPVLP